jgi:hypothetical protein
MMPNHHITKPVLIGEIQDDGQFEIVWETPAWCRRRLVRLPAGFEGPDRRLAIKAEQAPGLDAGARRRTSRSMR